MDNIPLPAISLFSGALGLDLGMEQAGFVLRVGVECNGFAVETIRRNRKRLPVIPHKLETVKTDDILKAAGLARGEASVVTGGPSCQAFSTAGQRGSLNDYRGTMFREFLRVVAEARPRFFVMENVAAILSAAIKHRPLNQRGPGFPRLDPEEEFGSAFALIVEELRQLNYYVVFGVLNAADYGVPQVRERIIFIGSRDGEPIRMPEASHAAQPHDGLLPWVTLQEAFATLNQQRARYEKLPKSYIKYLRKLTAGQNWRDLPEDLQKDALGAAYDSWGGRVGFFRRLRWDYPAPALTTTPIHKATMQCHPERLRPLSLREYAKLQQFPDSWRFVGGVASVYRQLGNAVPLGLGAAVGQAIVAAMDGEADPTRCGTVCCHDHAFIEQLSQRPKTQLNPPKMRKDNDPVALREWMAGYHSRPETLIYYRPTPPLRQRVAA